MMPSSRRNLGPRLTKLLLVNQIRIPALDFGQQEGERGAEDRARKEDCELECQSIA